MDQSVALAALKSIQDPIYQKPLVELGLVEVIDDGEAKIRIGLTSPSKQVRSQLEAEVTTALGAAGLGSVPVEWVLRVATREVTSQDPIPDVRNVLLVMSGKGGVGKSTVAANVALSLKRLGYRTGLLDADMYGPSMPTMFGIQGHPSSKDGKTIEPLERFGLPVMSIGFLLEDPTDAIIWRGPMLHGALQQFLQDVHWGPLDYLVIDLPPGTGDVALSLSQKLRATGVLMVTTPQEVALQDVYKGVSMCKKLNLPILGIVENMSFFEDERGQRHTIFGEGGGARVAEFAKCELLAQIPLAPAVREGGDSGTPVVQGQPDSVAALAFKALAETVVERVEAQHFERTGGDKAPATEAPKRLRIVR